jgi:hypothetical protein
VSKTSEVHIKTCKITVTGRTLVQVFAYKFRVAGEKIIRAERKKLSLNVIAQTTGIYLELQVEAMAE